MPRVATFDDVMIVELANASRHHPDVYLGVSPRGSLALFKGARAFAGLQERNYVIPDDVKALLEATFAHRLIISPSARIKSIESRSVVEQIRSSVPVPGTRARVRLVFESLTPAAVAGHDPTARD